MCTIDATVMGSIRTGVATLASGSRPLVFVAAFEDQLPELAGLPPAKPRACHGAVTSWARSPAAMATITRLPGLTSSGT